MYTVEQLVVPWKLASVDCEFQYAATKQWTSNMVSPCFTAVFALSIQVLYSRKKWISKKQMMNLRMVKCHKRRQRFGTCFVTMVYCTSCLASKPHGWGPSPTWTHPCHLPLEKHVQDSSNKHQVMGRFNSLELTRQIRFVPSNQLQTVNIKKEEHSWTHRPAIKRKQLQTA